MWRKLFCVAGVLFIAAYLWVIGAGGFAEIERQAQIGRDALYSEPLDLSRAGATTWRVPRDRWSYGEGEAMLSLFMKAAPGASAFPPGREETALRLKVSAQGTSGSGSASDRLVRDWYYTSNEPYDPKVRMWSSFGGGEAEHGLALVTVQPEEQIAITIDVTTPDTALSSFQPRLKLVGKHDFAVYEALPLIKWIRYGGLAICAVFVAGFAWIAWRAVHGRGGVHPTAK